jgi:hypothetical protein
MLISVDFDGTCVTHEFPRKGKDIGAEIVLRALSDAGHHIICMSMRSGSNKDKYGIDTVKEAKEWFAENDFRFDCLPPKEWLRKVTGSDVDVTCFTSYLCSRY